MTEEIKGLRDRQWSYGNLHGLRTGLNTAILYMEWAKEKPEAIPELLQILQELVENTEEQYDMVKADAKQFMIEHFGEEEENAEQGSDVLP